MSIGRLQAALTAATNEVTVAAANINFDFTLVKCEAPKEYQELGNALSKRRKDQAEMGSPHITARRLGALFEGVCPQTPGLVKAYGSRVSEIAERAKEKHRKDTKDSIFADHAGVDGTSIWAAATSSTTALQVHLLACMLARFWTGPEATSAWFELVKERKKEIATKFENDDEIPFATLTAAAQAEISRASLAEWDASVRSWLRTADSVKEREQKQLMLILANVNVSVSKDMQVLTSILGAWQLALVSMEKLIGGMAQSTNSGPALLALSSWHLYPDVLVVGPVLQEIRFKDDSVIQSSGILTIGLQDTQLRDDSRGGLHWSLSLAHLRHYGRPVEAKRQLTQDSSRLRFPQFAQAALGSILASWGMKEPRDYELVVRFFISAQAACQEVGEKATRHDMASGISIASPNHAWNVLVDAAWDFLDKNCNDHDSVSRLFKLGTRRSEAFSESLKSPPLFGLGTPKGYVRCLKDPEKRVSYLRKVSAAFPCFSGQRIIKYSRHSSKFGKFHTEYASTSPIHLHSFKEGQIPGKKDQYHKKYVRWVPRERNPQIPADEEDLRVTSSRFRDENGTLKINLDGKETEYYLVFGDEELAGIWQTDKANHIGNPSTESVLNALEADDFSPEQLMKQFHKELYVASSGSVSRISSAISVIAMVYKLLPDATISVNVLSRPVANTKWMCALAPNTVNGVFDPKFVSKEIAMSCVAYMDSGSLDIDPSLFTNVMALSSGDSLYISMLLACDPWERPHPFELRHVLGNVGRPGITMLVGPENTMIRECDPGSWKLIKNDEFNLGAEDHFKKTTMHLNFTDYYVPVFDRVRGEQDMEAFFLESFISVYDSGSWVGDIDISTLQQKLIPNSDVSLLRLPRMSCRGLSKHVAPVEKHADTTTHLISAESWDEVLDPPNGSFVVRANSNWIARLALAALLTQTVKESTQVVVCPNGFCWKCAVNDPEIEEFYLSRKSFIFIF